MGQKSILVGFNKVNFLYTAPNSNIKIFLLCKYFYETITQILKLKKILILNKNINFIGNVCNLNFNIFIKTIKIDSINKKIEIYKNKKLNTIKISSFLKIIQNIFKTYKIQFLKLNFKIMNFYVDKKLYKTTRFDLKPYKKQLFERHLRFFFDFCQICSLFYTNRLNSNIFIYNLALIFSRLKKKRHNKFLSFIKILFILLTKIIPTKLKISKSNFKLTGLKFILKGKIGGKTRTKNQIITVGNISNQWLGKNVDFSKIAVTTSYGVYGMKLWVYRSSKQF
jgi:hypothetical protein